MPKKKPGPKPKPKVESPQDPQPTKLVRTSNEIYDVLVVIARELTRLRLGSRPFSKEDVISWDTQQQWVQAENDRAALEANKGG